MIYNDAIKKIEPMIEQVLDKIPPDLKESGLGLKQFIKKVIIDILKKMDFVSYEEFETQKKILNRTREQIKELEEQITLLEKNLNNKNP